MVLTVLALAGCSSKFEKLLSSYDFPQKYKVALQLYEEEKFTKASQLFESIAMLSDNSPQEDTVKFYWAMSNYRNLDYATAEEEFRDFITTFARSPFAEEAEFRMIDCMYQQTYRYELDQNPTNRALTFISRYLLEHSKSQYTDMCLLMQDDLHQRLEQKAYEGAKLYYHMEDYLAAHHALKNVLKDNADNRYREDVLYYTAMAAYKYALNSIPQKQKERYMTFLDDYYNFVSEYPESKYRTEIDHIYKRVSKIIKPEENTTNE